MNSKAQQRIAASVRDQILDMRLGLIAPAVWAERYDAAEAQGVELDLTCQTRRAGLRIAERLLASAVEQAKAEILDDMREGVVPSDVRTFSALHDYTDANCYGGLCDDDNALDITAANALQDQVDQWLASGGAVAALEAV